MTTRTSLASYALFLLCGYATALGDNNSFEASLSAIEQEAIAEIAEHDDRVSNLIGKTIAGKTVQKIVDVARLCPRALSREDLRMFVSLSFASKIDSQLDIAEFTSSSSREDGHVSRVDFTFLPKPEDRGKLFWVTFNVFSFTPKFPHVINLVVGEESQGRRRVFGIGDGNQRISRHFRVESETPIKVSLEPIENPHWWFGACEVRELK